MAYSYRGNGMNEPSRHSLVALVAIAALAGQLYGGCGGLVEVKFDSDKGGNAAGGSTAAAGGANTGGGTGATGGGTGAAGGSNCQVDCSKIQTDQCHQAHCNQVTGQCVVANAANGTACDDELFCTVGEVCTDGYCGQGAPNDCGLSVPQCHVVTCSETTQSCSFALGYNNTSCTPDGLCEVNGKCQNGQCIGSPKDCTYAPVPDPKDCWKAVCNPQNGNCEPEMSNDGGGCTDPLDLCMVGKHCLAGSCIGGQPKDCSAYSEGCLIGACDLQTGDCYQKPGNPGDPCQPASSDACIDGVCDTQGVCQSVPKPDGDICEDGNPCTAGETCLGGQCQGGSQVPQTVLFTEDFSDNGAGWSFDPNDPNQEWQIGPSLRSSGHSYGNPDPAFDHTATGDNGVAGVVIGGNAATNATHPYYYLTSPVVDTSSGTGPVWLGFWRWLNSDYNPFMTNTVEVFDGSQWHVIWESGSSPGVQDQAWTLVSYELTPYKNANMQIRFGYLIGSTGVFTVSSWNIDDVVIANVICTN